MLFISYLFLHSSHEREEVDGIPQGEQLAVTYD